MTRSHEDLLARLRPRMFAIAYRMLGSVSEAEDIVQEASLRVLAALQGDVRIESPEAYATTVATRLAIDELRSARARREHYVGEWLPEPLLQEPGHDDPANRAEIADSMSLALLVLLERLSPAQRAVFLLHDVFDYGYREIGEILGRREDSVRQLAARARRYLRERRPRFNSSTAERDEIARRFFAAVEDGDVAALEGLLARDATLHGDGGGKVPALAGAVAGRQRIARTLLAWRRTLARANGQVRASEVNGQPGALLLDRDAGLLGVWSVDITDGHVQTMRSIVNPDKLGHLGELSLLTQGKPAATKCERDVN
jgi:RNA polymerase sigma-70 factor (TIGR02957 family)